jgi:uncharacterized protein YkwD
MKLLTAPLRMLALATALTAALAIAGCDNGGPGPDPNPTENNTAASMTTRINTFRTSGGGDALTTNTTLSQVAQAQADYNASHNINSSENGSGADLGAQMTDAGYNWQTYATLFNNLGEAATFNEWKSNPGYSSNILDPTLTDIGVGTAQVGTGLRRWVVILASQDVPTNGTVQQMLDLLNDYRTAHGQPEFTLNDNLTLVAQSQAEHNASVQANETATGEESILEQVDTTGYTYGTIMWTVANGGPETSLGLWTDTPTEQTNMQKPELTEVGIGVASGGTKQWWVVVFAEPTTP